MLRSILSVLAGAVLWAVLWLLSNTTLMAMMPNVIREGVPIESIGVLLLLLVLSVIYSIGAGYVTAVVGLQNEIKHALALGILQLSLGIFFQVQSWNLLPVWYHLSFLILLIPGNLFGGKLRSDQKMKPSLA